MLSVNVIEQLKLEFTPKFLELAGDIKAVHRHMLERKYYYQADKAAKIEAGLAGDHKYEVKLDFKFDDKDQKYEYRGCCNIIAAIYIDNQLIKYIFQAVIQGTQYNCGMRELVHLSANGSYPGAAGEDTGPYEEQLMSAGFDMIYRGLKSSPTARENEGGYACGVLVMSHDINSFVTRVARKHPMWQEIGIFNNPNYGGLKHEFVMFMANINGDRIEGNEDDDE